MILIISESHERSNQNASGPRKAEKDADVQLRYLNSIISTREIVLDKFNFVLLNEAWKSQEVFTEQLRADLLLAGCDS